MPPSATTNGTAPKVPKPVASTASGVNYLSAEEKARLNAKYGKLDKPKASDIAEVTNSGCKMQ